MAEFFVSEGNMREVEKGRKEGSTYCRSSISNSSVPTRTANGLASNFKLRALKLPKAIRAIDSSISDRVRRHALVNVTESVKAVAITLIKLL